MVPIPQDRLKALFGFLSTCPDLARRKKVKRRGHSAGEEADEATEPVTMFNEGEDAISSDQPTMSTSCMQGYKSALKWYYEEKECSMTVDEDKWLNQLIEGYKIEIARKREQGIMSVTEGKSRLTYTGYCGICEYMMKLRPVGKKIDFQSLCFLGAT